ncbi:MAG: MSMEG_4193 family putative phosphomutase [Micrococcales bacterium]|nr:MSMEG_4193 family putative phosphomutase [Micrococcales bacterium]
MPTVIFVRHARSSANTAGVLAGWMPGVFLDATGEKQAEAVGARLAATRLPIVEVVTSPLDRCVQTADRIVAALEGVDRSVSNGLGECHYGSWTGRPISELAKDELWNDVQRRPSLVRFPDSATYRAESLLEMQARALQAVRETDERIAGEHGPDVVWVAVSHGDVIKSVLADAAGAHLDDFQRLHVDPASVSVVRYADDRPFVLRLNDVGGDLDGIRPAQPDAVDRGDAVVGGGAGPSVRVEP